MQKNHEDYLMHHGIDGQKWGVKHGPPYPLDDSKSTGSRLKTKKKKKKSLGQRFNEWANKKYNENHKDEYEAKRKAREEEHAAEMAKYKDPEFRKKKYNDAKNNNSWDYAFAEFYFLNAHHRSEDKEPTTAEALKEYKKYLQDPDKWIQS